MKKIFGPGFVSRYLIYPFIAPIFICLRTYVVFLLNGNLFEEKIRIQHHPFILTFLMFLGELIGGSLQIYVYFIQPKKLIPKKEVVTISKFECLQPNPDEGWTYEIYLTFFGLASINLGVMTMLIATSFLNPELNNLEFQMKTFQMIITGFIGIKILKFPIFNHHYISMLLLLIGMLMITIETFVLQASIGLVYQICFLLLGYSIYSFEEVMQKYMMEFKYVSPFHLLIFKGLFGISLSLLLFVILNYIPCPGLLNFCLKDGPVEDILTTLKLIRNNDRFILYLTAYCFLCLVYNVLLVIIEKIYTPTHKAVSDTIASFFWECILYSIGILTFDYYKIAYVIGYVLRILGTLIYNEIVICYVCGLEVNTKKEIGRRSIEEDFLVKEKMNESNPILELSYD